MHQHAAAPTQGGFYDTGSDSSGCHGAAARRLQDAAVLGGSCGAATAAAASSRPRLRCSSGAFGSPRPVAGVALLVGLGMVSLLVPASNTRGLLLATPAAGNFSAVAATAHTRSLEVGMLPTSRMQGAGSSSALGSSSSSSSSNVADASGGGDSPVEPPVRALSYTVGTALGYCSSVLYLCSRGSQIYKNHSRQSSEGLALAMFMMAVCANLCTGSGIILRTFTKAELLEQLPWIIGTLGTISLDMVILWQSLKYASKANLARQTAAGRGGDGSSEEQRQLLSAQHQHHRVTVHLHHQQQAALPGARHAAVASGPNGGGHSRAMAIPAAADRHIIGTDRLPHLSSSAPAMPGWGGVLSHRPDAGRKHAVAAAADHVDAAAEAAPLLQCGARCDTDEAARQLC
eukprot:GHRQ01007956.1.p1 GENE.GHRQ01007956.1~~GHRQ01007956.1.p1  ORF type:complete len:443 (+),score=164.95 GHRQ01007956.1:126-1331(+)